MWELRDGDGAVAATTTEQKRETLAAALPPAPMWEDVEAGAVLAARNLHPMQMLRSAPPPTPHSTHIYTRVHAHSALRFLVAFSTAHRRRNRQRLAPC